VFVSDEPNLHCVGALHTNWISSLGVTVKPEFQLARHLNIQRRAILHNMNNNRIYQEIHRAHPVADRLTGFMWQQGLFRNCYAGLSPRYEQKRSQPGESEYSNPILCIEPLKASPVSELTKHVS
jgi:hypothetical protein